MSQVIVVGGGLAGLSAAHTVLERGGNVCVIDKNAFLGGNSTKATSGINGAGTSTQLANGVTDSREVFYEDVAKSAGEGLRPELVKVLTYESGPAVEWLKDSFELDLSKVSQLGAHSNARTHRGDGGRFPGAMITMTLMEKFDDYIEAGNGRARLIPKATVTELLTGNNGSVIGCRYTTREGETFEEYGPVIVSSGGFGADFTEDSILSQVEHEWRSLKAWDDVKVFPNLRDLPTTNGDHCSGDGIKIATAIGANTCDMEAVQVHPTGLVDPAEPDAKVKFLAAEALRGVGGILLDAHGQRFVDDLGKRDHVTGRMWNNAGPFRLCLNSAAARDIEWHCKHYTSRGLMKHFKNGNDLAEEMGIDKAQLNKGFEDYNAAARTKKDKFGKKYFNNAEFKMDDSYYVAIVTPVIHYTMGGIEANERAEVLRSDGSIIPGLYAGGEVMGGIHGKNRLGGNSLLDCVVYGRVSGAEATKYLTQGILQNGGLSGAAGRVANVLGHVEPTTITINQPGYTTTITVQATGRSTAQAQVPAPPPAVGAAAAAAAAARPGEGSDDSTAEASNAVIMQEYTEEEVAAHNNEGDAWVVIEHPEGEFKVYDVTSFLPDHPGGKRAPLIYAGKDATEEFMMLHKPEIIEKYGKDMLVGTLKK